MMEAASTSETSVNFFQATRRNIPKRQPSSYTPPKDAEISQSLPVFAFYKRKCPFYSLLCDLLQFVREKNRYKHGRDLLSECIKIVDCTGREIEASFRYTL
jgi:hypothetical protein